MSRRGARLMTLLALGLALLVVGMVAAVPAQVERRLNRLRRGAPPRVSDRARALHQRLFVADLHADTLLWNRDLLARASRGHVDLPRLQEGNVALQAFTVVTKAPRHMNLESNDASTDNLTWLVMLQRWPVATWRSLAERALHQAGRLREAAARSQGDLVVIESAADLAAFRRARTSRPRQVAGLLGLEGAHALEGDLGRVDALVSAGFRVVGLAHFFDNEFAGSAHGTAKGGLTEAGRELVRRLESRRVLVDLAHASVRTIDDVLAQATRPVIVSHTGVKGTCDNTRNVSDEHLRRIAATGGLVGIGVWEQAVCGRDGRAVARAILHAVSVAGVEHVGLGTDFDGAVDAPFDATGLAEITDALLAAGLGEREVAQVMGENAARLLERTLPGAQDTVVGAGGAGTQ
jgi:membrane dipeptidase